MSASPAQPPARSLPAGVKRVVKRKPDGSVSEYFYLRSNGARVPHPDDPDFERAKREAEASDARSRGGGIKSVIDAYCRSPEFMALAQRSKENKERAFFWIEQILKESELTAVKRKHVYDLRDIVAQQSGRGTATIVVSALSALYSWAINRGRAEHNPAQRIDKLALGSIPTWTEDNLAVALENLPEHLRRAVYLAAHTGQRRSDLIAMTWAHFDGRTIRLRQQKTGTFVAVPLMRDAQAELARWKAEAKSDFILVNSTGGRWSTHTINLGLWKRLPRLGLAGLNLHGLRKLAAVRLAEAGCTAHEIASILGHKSLSEVQRYTQKADQMRLAEAAITKLETARGKRRKRAA